MSRCDAPEAAEPRPAPGPRTRPAAGAPCALCTQPRPLSFHHLIPRRVHTRRWFRTQFSLEEMRHRGLWICRPCHDFLHRHFDEETLGRHLNTREALLADPQIARHLAWARRQKVQPGSTDRH